jgi:hypothetical protein
MIVHNEYLGVQIEWSQTMQDTLYELSQDEELWDKFRDFIQEKFPGVDTFHTDCVTFICGFDSLEEARALEREMKKRICHWINAYT